MLESIIFSDVRFVELFLAMMLKEGVTNPLPRVDSNNKIIRVINTLEKQKQRKPKAT